MARHTPLVVGNTLSVRIDGEEQSIAVGSNRWQDWLDQAISFAYEGSRGHFTARRQARNSGIYWYAYVTTAGQTRSAYLGRSAELTMERLEQAAARLHPEVNIPVPQDILPEQLASFEAAIRSQRGVVARRARRLLALMKEASAIHVKELAAAAIEVSALQRALAVTQERLAELSRGTQSGQGEVY